MSDSTIRVLHFSSHDEDCGVGKYQEQYLVGMNNIEGVKNKFFDSSPYKTRVMNPAELQVVLDRLGEEMGDYDILHIQHEFGLYRHNEFAQLVDVAKAKQKKVVVTVHASPSFVLKPLRLGGVGPRSVVQYLREKRGRRIFLQNHIAPMQRADLVIAHNDTTIQSLQEVGVPIEKIQKIIHPVPKVTAPPKSSEISDSLAKKPGDIIFCTVGFLHRYKGVFEAVKALKFLPDNYKLAIIGGMHPTSDELKIYDKIANLIDELGLQERVYITGFIKDDDRLNALIRECDVCIYAYDKVYYSSVSSGSLNLALANQRAVIAYPTETFKEIAQNHDAITVCQTFAYYELARELKQIDIAGQVKRGNAYAEKMSWPKLSHEVVAAYKKVLSN